MVFVRDGAEVARWELVGDRAHLAMVDELARLMLVARRLGCSARLDGTSGPLGELLDLVGLPVEVGREPECLEQPGIEEVVMPDDPVA